MKIRTCSDFLNEAEGMPTASAPQDKNVYTQAKGKVDAMCRNAALSDEDLQGQFDKAVADMETKDTITYYFGTKKLERRKIALDAESQQIAKQLQERATELTNMEKSIQA